MHGRNLCPSQDAEFEKLLRSHLEACLQLGQTLMQGELTSSRDSVLVGP